MKKNHVSIEYRKLDKILHKKIPLIVNELGNVANSIKLLRQELLETINYNDEETTRSN